MNSKIEYSEVINIFIPILILITVYILQYIYLMHPCEMCINERYPYFILIFIGFFTFLFKKYKNIKFTLVILSTFTILAGAVYTLRHIGIERGFIKSTSTCANTLDANSTDELLTIIENTPLIRCDEPTLLFNFASLAELNLITMCILLILNLFLIKKLKNNDS